ncbi:MAG: Holliday junction DNA helicase RuvA [Deltaproteobacteria bacterium]|nr:Holliday junction DNA helicase RuvA [Deltaproteobacteria bacterium]
MIGYLEGKLLKVENDRILLLANQVGYEVLLPAVVMEKVKEKSVGDEISLYIYYQQSERQPRPVLIGFVNEEEKDFFQYFVSVEDIGPLKAVKALNLPVQEIASAIESKDMAKLRLLKGIGSRTAKKIIATLQGKMDKFLREGEISREQPLPADDIVRQVLDVLVSQLGHKTTEAKQMIADAIRRNRYISTAEELFEEVYRGEHT